MGAFAFTDPRKVRQTPAAQTNQPRIEPVTKGWFDTVLDLLTPLNEAEQQAEAVTGQPLELPLVGQPRAFLHSLAPTPMDEILAQMNPLTVPLAVLGRVGTKLVGKGTTKAAKEASETLGTRAAAQHAELATPVSLGGLGKESVPVYHGSAEIQRRGGLEGGKFRLDIGPTGRPRDPGVNPDTLGTWWTTSEKDAQHFGRSLGERGEYVPGALIKGEMALENPRIFDSAETWQKFVNGLRGPDRSPARADTVRAAIGPEHDGIIIKGGGKGDATPEGADFYLAFDDTKYRILPEAAVPTETLGTRAAAQQAELGTTVPLAELGQPATPARTSQERLARVTETLSTYAPEQRAAVVDEIAAAFPVLDAYTKPNAHLSDKMLATRMAALSPEAQAVVQRASCPSWRRGRQTLAGGAAGCDDQGA